MIHSMVTFKSSAVWMSQGHPINSQHTGIISSGHRTEVLVTGFIVQGALLYRKKHWKVDIDPKW